MARDNFINNISLSGCRLIFRNLSGEEGQYNANGNRNFGVVIDDPVLAKELEDIGWNIKKLTSRDDPDDFIYWLKVKVKFGRIRPNIYMVTRNKKTLLDEETVGSIDFAEIDNVDIVIRPYTWNVNGKEGITAYVKNMYVTIVEDEFASKYDFSEEVAPFI